MPHLNRALTLQNWLDMVPSVCCEWAAVVYKAAVVGSTRCSLAEGLAGNAQFCVVVGRLYSSWGKSGNDWSSRDDDDGDDEDSLEEEWNRLKQQR